MTIVPDAQGRLNVGDGNRVYWETCGNPAGTPLVVLHGGPGQGCTERMRAGFDGSTFRIVLFDQRGCGRSTPSAADPATDMRYNTTHHLVADMELLRKHLGIDRWLLAGGSWGSTLALAYALRQPDRVIGISLSAISLTRPKEIDWLYSGVSRFFPEEHERFVAGADGAADPVPAYGRLLADLDRSTREQAAAAWARWEATVLSLEPGAKPTTFGTRADDSLIEFVRVCSHYYARYGWLAEDELIGNVGKLAGIPGALVHGRLDLSCPVETAYELANAWPGAELFVCNASGHRMSEAKREYLRAWRSRFAGGR
ncbi:prolyl aminopeptidase [Amycolatopsis jiangsuensis]|uniref:Proline iminopeptidase n=1 Tax=Amycolatopsis jiangsuensis TaxID=1181879 RepID=A0A840ISQ1_9PSEU|nr:prolyl aminopeptidase [Amycolatopsis jiangsuensis]MBB4684853.1 proline iminopeptidase [Amycolatopsis jiangsuensis]